MAILGLEGLRGGADVRLLAGLDGLRDDIELGHEVLQVEEVEDHADAAGDGGLAGDDLVGSGGKVVSPARCRVEQAGDDRLTGTSPELLEIAAHGEAGSDAAAVAVDAEYHRPHARVRFGRGQLLAEQSHGVLTQRERPHERRIQDQSIDVENRDPARFALFHDHRLQRAGHGADWAEIGDPRIDRPVQRDAVLRLDDEAGASATEKCN